MKKTTFIGSLGAVSLLLFSACDDSLTLSKGTGTIFPLVDVDPTVVTSRSSRAGSEIGDLTVSDLTLTLQSVDGSVNESFAYSDFPTDKAYPVGEYTLTASYGSDSEEGFEKPAVSGSCTLTVEDGKASKPSLSATLSKAMVAIEFDEGLLNYMTSVSARLHSAGGTYVDYPATETRAAYLKPGNTTVSVSFTKPNGKQGNLEVASFDADAKHCYKLALALGGDGYGSVEAITVKYDDMLAQEDVTVDISDDVLSIPAPEVKPLGFTPGEPVSIVESDVSSDVKSQFQVTARGEIAKAVLTTVCPSLVNLGWPEEVDLCAAPDGQLAAMQALGLKTVGLTGVTGKMALLDLTQVLAHIKSSPALATSEFTLVVTDKVGQVCDPVTFSVNVEPLELKISYEGFYDESQHKIDLNLEYNGSNPQNIKFEYINNRGIWKETTAKVERSGANYVATIDIPDNAQIPLQIRASVDAVSIVSEILKIEALPYIEISVAENDVYATYAWVDFASNVYDCSEETLELYISTEDEEFKIVNGQQKGSSVKITGLTPGTTYKARGRAVSIDSDVVTFTTEAATQIPGGDMESWGDCPVITGRVITTTFSWTNYTLISPWDGFNDMTLSVAAGANCQRAGGETLLRTDDRKSGTYAAIVRTVGWKANAATAQPSVHTAGELFLGTFSYSGTTPTPDYGTPFSSRPTALTFWYKYTEYMAGEKGLAEIKVLDADGNVLGEGSATYGKTDSYTQAVIPVVYKSERMAKAASIQIKFCSAEGPVNENNVPKLSTGPVDTNGWKQRCDGASFYIDDVELAY